MASRHCADCGHGASAHARFCEQCGSPLTATAAPPRPPSALEKRILRERTGIEGLGQVDLERRVHRNQELEGLSRMSFVILQAVMKRMEERRRVRLFAELGSTMKLPRSGRGHLSLEVMELADHERPPMIRIPEYLEKRRAAAGEPAD